jgi:carbon monoxide dehydrogenase subunit G
MGQRYGGRAVTRVRTTIEVEAPPEQVWRVVADPQNLPRWDRHIADVRGVPPEGLASGTEYETDVQLAGIRSTVKARVEELDRPHFARIRLDGLIDAVVTTHLTPVGEGRTRLDQEVDFRFRGGPVGRMAARALKLTGGPSLALRRGVLAQKRQVEEDAEGAEDPGS